MKKFAFILMSLFLTSGFAAAQGSLDLTFEKTSATEANVNVNGNSMDAIGITATVTSNYNWKTLSANSQTFPGSSMLCPDKNTKEMTAGNEGVFTITLSNVPNNLIFNKVVLESAAINSSGAFQADNANAQLVNFTLKNGDETLAVVEDKAIKVNSLGGEKVEVVFPSANNIKATDGTITLTVILSTEGEVASGCFYGLTKVSLFEKTIELIDGEEYTATEDAEYSKITYKRTFGHNEWQALYVPFTMSYDDLKDEFYIARIIQIVQVDKHLHVSAEIIESGTLNANYPYLIKPYTAGEKTFKANSNILKKAAKRSISCGTVDITAKFTGTYSTVTDMYENDYFAMSNGSLKRASKSGVTLAPFRWYLSIESNDDSYTINEVRMKIGRSGETGIKSTEEVNISAPVYYDLSGRKVDNPTRGIYIVNGKKVLVK